MRYANGTVKCDRPIGDTLRMPVFVLAHASRDGLILPHLSRVTHTLCVNPDWPYGDNKMHPTYEGKCPLTHYRVFKGWQMMAERFLADDSGSEVGLFFEDDAVPNSCWWTRFVNRAAVFMDDFELMYLCGRMFNPDRFDTVGVIDGAAIRTIKPGVGNPDHFGGRNHVFGCCAALMSRVGALKMTSAEWTGIPGDVYFPDNSRFCFVGASESPFTHDSSQGSLIDPKINKKYL